jgi:hypothetical protein
LASADASAAEPTNNGKRFRFHGELDVLSFSHFNPDGAGDSYNTIGFGFGRTTGIDAMVRPPIWSLGFGYVFLDGNAVAGARFAFNLGSSSEADDDGDGNRNDARTTLVGGQLIPYFRYMFLPGKRLRPFAEARFGVGGTTTTTRVDSDPEFRSTTNVVYPAVGVGGGIHYFIIDSFSIDAGITFDYAAPHAKNKTEVGDVNTDTDYEKSGDFINLAAQVGFSAWF